MVRVGIVMGAPPFLRLFSCSSYRGPAYFSRGRGFFEGKKSFPLRGRAWKARIQRARRAPAERTVTPQRPWRTCGPGIDRPAGNAAAVARFCGARPFLRAALRRRPLRSRAWGSALQALPQAAVPERAALGCAGRLRGCGTWTQSRGGGRAAQGVHCFLTQCLLY